MKKKLLFVACTMLFCSCANEFTKVYKSTDADYRYEYAKQCFVQGKYMRASTLLEELVTIQKGGEYAQESLYMLGMAQYLTGDYESASATFKKYGSSYPKGDYAAPGNTTPTRP